MSYLICRIIILNTHISILFLLVKPQPNHQQRWYCAWDLLHLLPFWWLFCLKIVPLPEVGRNVLPLRCYIYLNTFFKINCTCKRSAIGGFFYTWVNLLAKNMCFYLISVRDSLLVLFTRGSWVCLTFLCLSHAYISMKFWWGHALQDSIVSPIKRCHIKVEDDWDGWTSDNVVAGHIVFFSSSLSTIIAI